MSKYFLVLLALCLVPASEAILFNKARFQNVKSDHCLTVEKDAGPLSAAKCTCGPYGYQLWTNDDAGHVINEWAKSPYMDVFGVKQENGATVGIWSLAGTKNQNWKVTQNKNGNYAFVAEHSGKCLHEGSDGKIDQWQCFENDETELWKMIENPCHFSKANIKNVKSGHCLTVDKDGGPLSAAECTCGPYQFWKNDDAGHVINELAKSPYMDVFGIKQENGATVGIYSISGTKNQNWIVNQNTYIQNVKSGHCLTIDKDGGTAPLSAAECTCGPYQFWKNDDAGHVINELAKSPYMDVYSIKQENGATVGSYSLSGTKNQNWRVTKDKNGNYAFVAEHSGKCLHEGSGGKVDQWECFGNDETELWKLIENPCGTLPSPPSGSFQLQNTQTGKCAVPINNGNQRWVKAVSFECSCSNKNHYWDWDKKTLHNVGSQQCLANWDAVSSKDWPGVTICDCQHNDIHEWRLTPLQDDSFNIISSKDGRCVYLENGAGDNTQLQFATCDRNDGRQKWKYHDECHPQTHKTTNIIPTHLTFFFESGSMNWLTPTKYTLLINGHWDSTTLSWITSEGKHIKPDTPEWTLYFGETVKPSFLSILFPPGKTSWNDVFGWMDVHFFEIWTDWKPTPITKPTTNPPPQPTTEIPSYLAYFFDSGSMNWLTPTRFTLLQGGRWDPTTLTWITADGRQIKPDNPTWTIYFGDVKPSFLSVIFPAGKSEWNDVFGWMDINFFQNWTGWEVTTPEPHNVIPHTLTIYFDNGQMNWLTPERYSLLVGGRWDPVRSVWITVNGKEIHPSTTEWTIYFGDLTPAQLSIFFPNGSSWNDVFGWMDSDFVQHWTGWKVTTVTKHIPIIISGNIPQQTITIFGTGRMNWLTPDRIKLLDGGEWTGSEYITSNGLHVIPGTTSWIIYFGSAEPADVNSLFGGTGGKWDILFHWLSEAMKNVPAGVSPGGTFPWDSYFKKFIMMSSPAPQTQHTRVTIVHRIN